MELILTKEEEKFRDEVRGCVAQNISEDIALPMIFTKKILKENSPQMTFFQFLKKKVRMNSD